MKVTISYQICFDTEAEIEYVGVVGGVGAVGDTLIPVHRFTWVEKYPEGIFDGQSGEVEVWVEGGKVEIEDDGPMIPDEVRNYIYNYAKKHLM